MQYYRVISLKDILYSLIRKYFDGRALKNYSNEEETLLREKIILVGVKTENIRMLPSAEFFDKV